MKKHFLLKTCVVCFLTTNASYVQAKNLSTPSATATIANAKITDEKLFPLARELAITTTPTVRETDLLRRALQGLASANRLDLALKLASQPALKSDLGVNEIEIYRIVARVRALQGDLKGAQSAAQKIGWAEEKIDALLAIVRSAVRRKDWTTARDVSRLAAQVARDKVVQASHSADVVGYAAQTIYAAGETKLAHELLALAQPSEFSLESVNDDDLMILERARLLCGLDALPRSFDAKRPAAVTARRREAVVVLAWLSTPMRALAEAKKEENAFWRAVMLAEIAIRQEVQGKGKGASAIRRMKSSLTSATQAIEAKTVTNSHIWDKDEAASPNTLAREGTLIAAAFFAVGDETAADAWTKNLTAAIQKLVKPQDYSFMSPESQVKTYVAEALCEPFFWSRLSSKRRREITLYVRGDESDLAVLYTWRPRWRLFHAQIDSGDRSGALQTARELSVFGQGVVKSPRADETDAELLLQAAHWLAVLGDSAAAKTARAAATRALAKYPVEKQADGFRQEGFPELAAEKLSQRATPSDDKEEQKFYWIGYYAVTIAVQQNPLPWIEKLHDKRDQIDALSGFLVARALPLSRTLKTIEEEWTKEAWGASTFYPRKEAIEREDWARYHTIVQAPASAKKTAKIKS